MSNELVRYGQKALVESDGSVGKSVGTGLVATGAGGLALFGVAALVPFVGAFGLSVLMLIVGAILYMVSK